MPEVFATIPAPDEAVEVGSAQGILMLLGAGCFGAVLGWYLYYVNRYRKDEVRLADLVTLVGVIGGGAVLALFPKGTVLFGAYGIGLAVGFFAYFWTLVFLVWRSKGFTTAWFLDGRRPKIPDGEIAGQPGERAMGQERGERPMGH
jgi:hypothetical protein